GRMTTMPPRARALRRTALTWLACAAPLLACGDDGGQRAGGPPPVGERDGGDDPLDGGRTDSGEATVQHDAGDSTRRDASTQRDAAEHELDASVDAGAAPEPDAGLSPIWAGCPGAAEYVGPSAGDHEIVAPGSGVYCATFDEFRTSLK